MEMNGQTIQSIFLDNIKSGKEAGITFIDGPDGLEYLSYKKLYLEAGYILHALQERGLNPGDEVIFQFQSNRSFVITFWACVLGNFIPVPIVLGTTSDIVQKLNKVWQKLKNPYLITDAPFLASLIEDFNFENDGEAEEILSNFIYYAELPYTQKAAAVPATSSDLVFIQFSSGSTGSPKGVMNRQDGILYNINMSLEKCAIQASDKFLGWMPLTHDMGLVFFHILPLLANANQYLMPPMLFLSSPELWLKNLSEQQITISGSPNFGYVHVLENIGKAKLDDLSFEPLRLMINSAEPVSIETCRKFAEALKHYGFKKDSISPSYGLAEAVLGVSLYNEEDGFKEYFLNRHNLNIGDKVEFLESNSNASASFADLGTYNRTEIKITNEIGEILADDTLGIIQLKSPAMTLGYYNDDEATRNVISHDGWFNTGDVGFIHNNRLVITGRKKEMIIINGQNYFPNDLDNLIEELPEIKFQQAASCSVFSEEKHQDELFVFVHYSGSVKDFVVLADEVKKLISERIGVTVKNVIAVEKIHKTTSGKIQRYVLRDKYLNGEYNMFLQEFEQARKSFEDESYVAPGTDLEKKLAKVWEDFFGMERIGIKDNFFHLGGNSLGIGILALKIQEAFDVRLDVSELFRNTNFSDQLEVIKNSLGKTIVAIEAAPVKPFYPLFSTQKRLFILNQMDPESISYNTPVVLQVEGNLDVALCEDVFKKIIKRHEILRTSFHDVDGEAIQKIHENVDFSIQYTEDAEGDVQELLKKHIKPFNLSEPPLIRVLIIKENDATTKIILDIHHIVIDAASFEVLIAEFQSLYGKGELKDLTIQYRDFVVWQENKLRDKQLTTEREFWLSEYNVVPEPLNMPFDFPKSNVKNAEGSTVSFEISTAKREKLENICKQHGVTMSGMTLTIFYVLLSKLTNQEDIIIGTSTIGRWHSEFKNLIGLFINTLPLRCAPKGDLEFSEFLGNVKTHVLDCLANEEYSFDRLLNHLELKPNANSNALFNVTFEYHNFNWTGVELPDLRLSKIDHPNMFSKFDLVLRVVEKETGSIFNLDYQTNLFKKETVERFASYYNRIIDWVLKGENKHLKDIEIVSEEEIFQLVKEFNDTSEEYEKEKSVLEVFAAQVSAKPESTAVVFGEKSISYQELDQQSDCWAGYLIENNVKPGDVVGLILTRSVEMIIAMFAIMKAGASYVPIDPGQRISRIVFMLEECKAKMVISNSIEKPEELASHTYITIEELNNVITPDYKAALPKITAEDLMYIIFTSGSTGKPKGVMMRHSSVINLVKGLKSRVYGSYGEKPLHVALLASYAFDASVQQIYGSLLQGHSLYITDDETRKDGVKLLSFYNDNKIDLSDGTPTHLRFFVDALTEDSTLNTLSGWILAGEILQKELVRSFYSKLGTGVQLYNFYGPTETCVDSTGYKIDPEQLDVYDFIPIGKPLPNERIYITDQYGNLAPIGTIGELCIAGDGLAIGYVGDAELTSKKFDSEWMFNKERVYRTGDMAKWLSDGNLEYHGRNDDHVKIRGYRIHLGEIESALNNLAEIQQSVVIVNEDSSHSKQLVAYVVCNEEADSKKVQELLEVHLPEYMVPRVYVYLTAFPMTDGGKIDKKALPVPETATTYVAPTGTLEMQFAELWQDLLGVDQVGVHDNFYELGGDSIKAIQLASRSKAIGIHFQVKDIFNYQTIYEIVLHLKSVKTAIQETGLLLGEVPLHPIQKLFFERGHPVINHHNQSILLKVSKSVSSESLVYALSELVKHHDALRLHFSTKENEAYPSQHYGSFVPKLITEQVISLNDIAAISSKYQAGLDIFNGDLVRFVLLETAEAETENRLFIAIHHLAVDGVSFRIITEDLTNLIENHSSGNRFSLPAKETSYRQWIAQVSAYAATAALESEYIYWKEVLSNYTPLPVDKTYDNKISYQETGNIRVSLASPLTYLLVHETNNMYGTEINDILISALSMTLSGWIDAPKVVIAMEGHGREELFEDVDINRTVGWFTSVYPVCLDISEADDIGILIADTKDMLRSIPNKGIGYNLLQFESGSDKIKSDLSVFYEDLIFNYLGDFDTSFSREKENKVSLAFEAAGPNIATDNVNPYKISIDSIIMDGSLYLDWNYDAKLYKKETIQTLADNYIAALEDILSHSTKIFNQDEIQTKDQDFEIISL
ncbi:amino acid adenylation domain-containing protein [Flavobacterium cupreum]|uniref:Amino acid adenylation domain-containing protein n=3 Tax=Flavobacterium TaxID=237 RepID=A0A434A2K3_9FLAO|nr:non-ribosomal peptide synthetase [Flavobacterium cupreum]RUT68621.1 amino acid adenylation domain-containing protein [Flavobacterium cupreum]